MKLRDYQDDIDRQIAESADDVLVQLDTGAGKTPIIASVASRAPSLIVAHRNVLIAQASTHLARAGIWHAIIATRHTRDECRRAHVAAGIAADFVDMNASVAVASLFSLASRLKRGLVKLHWSQIIVDEAHHVAPGNTWSTMREAIPAARLIGFTATPCRLDGAPLGKSRGGLFDRLIQAESLRENSVATLIQRGYLSDYRAFSISSDIDYDRLRLGASGDYTEQSLISAMRGRAVYGDAIEHYQRLAPGQRALAVCVSILNAEELAEKARADGIAATVIHSKLGASECDRRLSAFRDGRVKLLANVDMLGEGFDLPDIEALIMLRPTASFSRYRQWIGRALRPAPDKREALLIDHVGNIVRHGLPDDPVNWSLDHDIPQQRTNLIDCLACGTVFRAWLDACPQCSAAHDLNERRQIGGHYVNQDVIDFALCESRRKLAHVVRLHETEVVRPSWGFSHDLIGQTCRLLADWIADTLDASPYPRSCINDFLRTLDAPWLIARFTVADLKSGNTHKVFKEFAKWQKASSSAPTRKAIARART